MCTLSVMWWRAPRCLKARCEVCSVCVLGVGEGEVREEGTWKESRKRRNKGARQRKDRTKRHRSKNNQLQWHHRTHIVTNDLYVILLIQWKMMVIITIIIIFIIWTNDWTLCKYNSETVGGGLSDKVNKVLKEFRCSQSANNGAVSFPFENFAKLSA